MPEYKARKRKAEYELSLTVSRDPGHGELKPGVGAISMRLEADSYPDLLDKLGTVMSMMWEALTDDKGVRWVPEAVMTVASAPKYTSQAKQVPLPLASMEVRREREMTMIRETSPWGLFLKDIDEMLDQEEYQFAADTLSGIRDTVEKTCRITDNQRRAVENIRDGGERGKRSDGFKSRRYEGFGR